MLFSAAVNDDSKWHSTFWHLYYIHYTVTIKFQEQGVKNLISSPSKCPSSILSMSFKHVIDVFISEGQVESPRHEAAPSAGAPVCSSPQSYYQIKQALNWGRITAAMPGMQQRWLRNFEVVLLKHSVMCSCWNLVTPLELGCNTCPQS